MGFTVPIGVLAGFAALLVAEVVDVFCGVTGFLTAGAFGAAFDAVAGVFFTVLAAVAVVFCAVAGALAPVAVEAAPVLVFFAELAAF